MSNLSSENTASSGSASTTTKTPFGFIVLTIILSSLFSLAAAEWVLTYQKQKIASSDHMDPGMIQYDDQLGWKLKPNWTGSHHHFDYDVDYSINRNGFRSLTTPVKKPFYSIVGDSFTFGLGVNDNETFVSLLNDKTNITESFINTSFINYGVPGYSTDQQLLLIKKLNASNQISSHVILVLYLGNDIFDNTRAYPLQADHGKPYFKLVNKTLVLENTPVPLIAKSAVARKETISGIVLGIDDLKNVEDSWLSQLELSRRLGLFQNQELQNQAFQKGNKLTDQKMQSRFSESLLLLTALLEEMNKEIEKNSGKFEIVILPGRSYVETPTSLSAQYQDFFRRHIVNSTNDSTSIKVLDLASQLRALHESGIDDLYHPNEGHLTKRGHQYVAKYLSAKLPSDGNSSD